MTAHPVLLIGGLIALPISNVQHAMRLHLFPCRERGGKLALTCPATHAHRGLSWGIPRSTAAAGRRAVAKVRLGQRRSPATSFISFLHHVVTAAAAI